MKMLLIILLGLSFNSFADSILKECNCIASNQDKNSVNYETIKKIDQLKKEMAELDGEIIMELQFELNTTDVKLGKAKLLKHFPFLKPDDITLNEKWAYGYMLQFRAKKKDFSMKDVYEKVLPDVALTVDVYPAEVGQHVNLF